MKRGSATMITFYPRNWTYRSRRPPFDVFTRYQPQLVWRCDWASDRRCISRKHEEAGRDQPRVDACIH